MGADRGEHIGIGAAQDYCHRGARGQAGDVDASRVHAVSRGDVMHDAGEDRGFAAATLLVLAPEPVPAARAVVAAGLFGVGDQDAVGIGQCVHPRAGREILR